MLQPEQDVAALLEPSSIAVVGASPTSFVGRILCENLRSIGFSGDVFPVNPRYEEVEGWRCYPSLSELPKAPEAVVAAVRIDMVPPLLEEAASTGARAAVVPGGGFSETGPAAVEAQTKIRDVAARFGMAVCGPNCMGVISPGRSAMYIGTLSPTLLPGRVALVSQSGSVCEAAVNMGPRVGWSAIVSSGTEVATTAGTYLRYFAGDDRTNAVALFVEGFRDPEGFVEGARALRAAGKPLAVLQAGRSKEQRAAIAAHSGTLAGAEEVVTGLLHQLGAIGVDDLDELFEASELLGHGRLPKGRRLFVATDSGGEAQLIADHGRALRLEFPPPSDRAVTALRERWPHFSFVGNPIDPWGVDPDYDALYSEILSVGADEDVDVLAMALDKVTPWAGGNETDLGVAAARALIAASERAPDVLPVFFTVHSTGAAVEGVREPLREAGIPLLHGLRPSMVAIRRAWFWRWWPERTPEPKAEASPDAPAPIEGRPGVALSEWRSREALAPYGIPFVEAARVASPDDAVDAARSFGYPVVVKANADDTAHKAAAGLVKLGLVNDDDVRRACAELTSAAAVEDVLVQPTAHGVELICGARRDPLFGPVVLLGAGGVLTEVLRDVAVRVCPPAKEDLEEMLDECAAGRMLRPTGADAAPVLDVVAALSRFVLDHPEVEEVDLNPVIVSESGAVAVDALVVMGAKGERR